MWLYSTLKVRRMVRKEKGSLPLWPQQKAGDGELKEFDRDQGQDLEKT